MARTVCADAIVDSLRFGVKTPPGHGVVTTFCAGLEVMNYTSCKRAGPGDDQTLARAYFEYRPASNYFGDDVFTFYLTSASDPQNRTFEGDIKVEVRPVNDAPTMQDMDLRGTLNRNKTVYSGKDASVTPLTLLVGMCNRL